MVNATEWIQQNYPINSTCQRQEDKENYGKRVEEITNLDISNQNLEGILNCCNGTGLTFSPLRKVNISFNKLLDTWCIGGVTIWEELDASFNQMGSYQGNWLPSGSFPWLRKLNLSHNSIEGFSLAGRAPRLTHLDVSNNLLTNLTLQSDNLQVLDCHDNPTLANLNFSVYPNNLIYFDCLGIKFDKSITSTSTTSLASVAETVYLNDNFALTTGLGIPLGISVLGWVILGFVFFYKYFLLRTAIPTPGS